MQEVSEVREVYEVYEVYEVKEVKEVEEVEEVDEVEEVPRSALHQPRAYVADFVHFPHRTGTAVGTPRLPGTPQPLPTQPFQGCSREWLRFPGLVV